jgi:hypothetical protein
MKSDYRECTSRSIGATPYTLSILLSLGVRDGGCYVVEADGSIREAKEEERPTEEEQMAMEAWRREQTKPRVAG